jgi:hypothetical protein
MKESKQFLTEEEAAAYKGLLRFAKKIKLNGNKILIIISPIQKCKLLPFIKKYNIRDRHFKSLRITNSLQRKGILKVVKLSHEWCFNEKALPEAVPNEKERDQLICIIEKDIQNKKVYKNPIPHPTVYEIKQVEME